MKLKRTFKYEKKEVNGKKITIRIPTHEGQHKRPDCNAQCIYSPSNHCACMCGGANHGAGLSPAGRQSIAWVKDHLKMDISNDPWLTHKPRAKSMKDLQKQVDASAVTLKVPSNKPKVIVTKG